MTSAATRRRSFGVDRDSAVLAVSLALALLGVVVLIGWYAHLRPLVQIIRGGVSMQYNTALCFIGLGMAGVGLSTRRRLWIVVGGAFAGCMGGAVILEYATGRSFGIDTLMFYPWQRNLSADPGRMSLTTAASFALTGAGLVAIAARPAAFGVLAILNSLTLSLALTSLIGYAFHITDVLPFSLGSQMALHTSVALFTFSIAMIAHAWTHARAGPDGLPTWIAGISVSLLPVLFVGSGALFPRQSWRIAVLETVVSLGGVGLITLAVQTLTTAKVAYKGLIMIAVPLVLLLTFVGLVARVKQESESAQVWALHSTEVLGVSASLLMHIAETESAVRGYVITSDQAFVTEYAESARLTALTTERLRQLVNDNPTQEAYASAIDQLTSQRMRRFAEIFTLIARGNKTLAQEDIKGESGPELMKQVRAELALFSSDEARLGAGRRDVLNDSWQRLSWLLVAGASAAILLAGILTLSFSRGLSGRLQQLRKNAINLAVGATLAPRLTGDDEIGQLDRVFHEMAGSLAAATAREKATRILEGQVIDVQHAEALRKIGALQAAVFESVHFSSIATDVNGAIQIFNAGAERMFGYTAAEVVNKITPVELHDADEVVERAAALTLEFGTPIAPGFEALIFKAARGIEDIYEVTKVRKDGSRFPAILSVSSLRDGQGAIIGYLLIGSDNTARKQAEADRRKLDQRLRDQHFYTRSLIESNIDALMTTDPFGIITDVNKQTEALTGRSRDELIGAPFKNYFTEPARADAGIRRVLAEGKVTNYELTARTGDGAQTVVSYNATTFYDRDRRLQGVFASARDVTELKQFEHTLQQKNVELESASRMKSEFLANMSHELRTPLNAIIGFSEVLRDGLIGDLSDRQRGFIADIFGSGTHLLSLINEILDLSKVEAGKMMLDLESMDVSSLLADSMAVVREMASVRQIGLQVSIGPIRSSGSTGGAPGSIVADARKVKQILYNLLSNAVKFTPEGGAVTLRAAYVSRADVGRQVGPWPGRTFAVPDNDFTDFLEISVTDSGLGMSLEGLARLFVPFSQIDGGLARRFEGTGLGLAMVKLLAELHGGTVAAAGAEGEGARFTVWLPLRAAPARVLAPDRALLGSHTPAAAETKVALIVEDDFRAADLIRVQLEAEGFTVLHAASAEAAFVLAVQQPLALITLDVMLPNMDGWEFLCRIKQEASLSQIPVVIISIVADRNKGYALGAATVMQKPISRQELHESLVALGLFPIAAGRQLKILVVDDDPKAVELAAIRLISLASTVLRAYGGSEAIEIARRELPDLIVLDLMMPEVTGFDVVEALTLRSDTARIPIVVVTAKEITAADHDRLNGYVTTIMEKADMHPDRFLTEVRRAMAGRRV